MKIAVTGAEGRIGSHLVAHYSAIPIEADILEENELKEEIESIDPDVVIHAAGYSDVTKAQSEPHSEECSTINIRGAANVRESFSGYSVFLSSSHVFGGTKESPYSEYDKRIPLNHYGFTKWAMEAYVESVTYSFPEFLIVRSPILYGGFPFNVIERIATELELGGTVLPRNMVRSFLYLDHFAQGLMYAVEHRITGPLHIAASDYMSYHDLGNAMAAILGLDSVSVTVDDVPPMVPRPRMAALSVKKAQKLGVPLWTILEGLQEFARVWPTLKKRAQ